MKRQLHLLKSRIFGLLFLLWSAAFFAQTTLVNYQFSNNLTADAGAIGNPTLKFFNAAGVEVTPTFENQMLALRTAQEGFYLELTINTTGYYNINVEWYGEITNTLFGTGKWTLRQIVPATTPTEIGSMDLNILNARTQRFSLNSNADNQTSVKIQIVAQEINQLLLNARLLLDNLKITSGSPKIRVYTGNNTDANTDTSVGDNVYIPHQSAASRAFDTDFGTRQTTDAALTRTFKVRNFQGETGSKLKVTSIVVQGANPGDFTVSPSTLGDIDPTNSGTDDNGSRMKSFNISFLPLGDGIRTAEVYVHSNAAPSPYVFTVVGTGASCTLTPSTYAENTMAVGQQALTANYSPSTDLIGGVAYASGSNYNTLNTRLYPNGNLYTSASTSWFVRSATKTVEFGGLDISNQKNVVINFGIAAFATSSSGSVGVNSSDYVTLAVLKPDNTWSEEIKLTGSNSSSGIKYNYLGGDNLSGDYDGDNTPISDYNGSHGWFQPNPTYKQFTLNIPASSNISNLKFRITAKTSGDNRMWLIDDVKVLTSNAEYRVYNTAGVWKLPNGNNTSPANTGPNEYQKAVIEGNFNNSGNWKICECEVKNGGSLNIPTSTSVTVRGKITNLGNGDNFIVQTGGNLIQIEDEAVNSGSITAERYVTDMDNVLGTQLDYVYWSSPVTGQDLRAFSPGTRTNKIFYYNEPTDFFKAVNFATEPNFVPGKGYAFEAETTANGTHSPNATGYNETYKFKGTPNNGVISPDVQRSANTGSGGTVEHGYNLIGNPYPSNISFPEFYAMNSTKIYNTAWFWTNNLYTQHQQGSGYTPNNYAVWTGTGGAPATSTSPANGSGDTFKPDGIVAVGQGFIVQVRPEHIGAGTQQLIFKNKNTSNGNMVRVSTAGHFFNKNAEQKDRFWLKLISSDSIVNTQLIGYIEGATNDFEKDYDAEIMGMSSNIFYSTLEDRKLQIQGKAAFDPSDNVQLGANIFKNGTYTIAIENPEGIFNAGQKVYLKDNLLNRWVDLNAQAYTFEATKGITEGRFEIVYESPTVLATDAVTKDEVMVYRDSGDFVVKAKSKKITMLEVYDASGRLVYTAKPNDTRVVISGDRLNRGVYILKINQDGVVTAKKILK